MHIAHFIYSCTNFIVLIWAPAVTALQELYKSLNTPPQLTGWRLDGGDPCDESWNGVSCFGSSVMYLELYGLDLSGSITAALYNLKSLKQLDISSNSIGGELPYVLPPHATHINMASNKFTGNIPQSLADMKYLVYLNLSHNLLSGPIGNVFNGLQNLRQLDLSYNKFTGDVRSSFRSLTNLTGLKIQENYGVIPNHFQSVPNLWIGGNSCEVSGNNCPPWDGPLETKARDSEQNTYLPPATQSSVKNSGHKNKKLGIFVTIIGCVVAAAAAIACMAARQDANNEPPPEQPARLQFCPPRPPERLELDGRFIAGKNYQIIVAGKAYHADTEEKVVKKAKKDQEPEEPPPTSST
ncbi:protein STRUBBELIG-RECEPTOR FAMILY 2-like [Rosa sericea]